MRLEQKNQPLATWPRFVIRLVRYALFAGLLIFISLGIGVMGYCYFGHLSFIDGFYNASLILTGMGPVDPMETNAAKLFASFYALYSGVAFLSVTAVFFAPIIHRVLHLLHFSDERDG